MKNKKCVFCTEDNDEKLCETCQQLKKIIKEYYR